MESWIIELAKLNIALANMLETQTNINKQFSNRLRRLELKIELNCDIPEEIINGVKK